MKEEYDSNQNLAKIYDQENLLDVLIEIDRAFDSFDLYAFSNWINGEIVHGPELSRYWIKIILKYPYEEMPDPTGGMRLLQHGAKLGYQVVTEEVPIDIKGIQPEDRTSYYEDDGTRKTEEEKMWLIHVTMPRRFIDDIEVGSIDVDDDEDEQIDKNAVQSGEEEGLDQETMKAGGPEANVPGAPPLEGEL